MDCERSFVLMPVSSDTVFRLKPGMRYISKSSLSNPRRLVRMLSGRVAGVVVVSSGRSGGRSVAGRWYVRR